MPILLISICAHFSCIYLNNNKRKLVESISDSISERKTFTKMSNHGIQFIFKTQFWLVFFLSFYQMWRRLLSIVQILYCGEQLMAAQISIQLTNINGNSASNVPTVSRYNCAKDAAIKESTAPAMKKDKNKIHISMQIEIDVWHYY